MADKLLESRCESLGENVCAAGACPVQAPQRPLELVLSGSGAASLAHIGVLRALQEAGLKADQFLASSQSSLVATLAANGVSWSEIAALAHGQDPVRLRLEDWLGGAPSCGRMFCPISDLTPVAQRFVRANRLQFVSGLRLVCWDLVAGKAVVQDAACGSLSCALTAAMSIPGIARPLRQPATVMVDCAAAGGDLQLPCSSARRIVCNAHPAHEVAAEGWLRIDGWLQQRQRLLTLSPAHTACGAEDRSIQVLVKLASGCGCQPLADAIDAIIACGYDAARAALASSGD